MIANGTTTLCDISRVLQEFELDIELFGMVFELDVREELSLVEGLVTTIDFVEARLTLVVDVLDTNLDHRQ